MKIIKTNSLTEHQISQVRNLERVSFEKENLQNRAFLSNEINVDKSVPCFYLGYDDNNNLLAFLTTFIPSQHEAEILAVTLPSVRNRGYFRELFAAARTELFCVGIENVLFAIEANSQSGKRTLQSFGKNEFVRSEYRMVCVPKEEQSCLRNISYNIVDNENKHEMKKIQCDAFDEDDTSDNFIESVINSDERKGYIQYFGEQPIGSLSINYEDDDIFLYGVAVAKNQRGKGFGKELVKFAQNIAFREEKKIVLDVDSDNPVAFSLYKSCGFVIDFQVDYYRTNIK